jgi:hypothetical protein
MKKEQEENKCFIVGPAFYDIISKWYQVAVNEPEISRFLSMYPYYTVPTQPTGDWEKLYVMDRTHQGLLVVAPDRETGSRYAFVSLWVLPTELEVSRQRIVHLLWKYLKDVVVPRYGIKYIEWVVHGTNVKSLAFSRRRATTEQGTSPEYAWDCKLGTWTDRVNFLYKVENR